jgi:hypothetical protein
VVQFSIGNASQSLENEAVSGIPEAILYILKPRKVEVHCNLINIDHWDLCGRINVNCAWYEDVHMRLWPAVEKQIYVPKLIIL